MKIKKIVLIIFCLSLVQSYLAVAMEVRTNAVNPNLKVSPTNIHMQEEAFPKYNRSAFASLFVNTILKESEIKKISIVRPDRYAKYF